MIGAIVCLDGRELIRYLRRMVFRVTVPATQSVFFIHPGDDANGSLRVQF